MEDIQIYHIMIDRFFPTNAEFAEREFNGGNINGIIEKLDYIQALGMNGIMLTPFYQTNEYHGYHIINYEKVEPHFGTWDDVEQLIQEVHKRKMMIVADFVPNHCHITNSLYADGKHKEWFLFDRHGIVKGFSGLDFLPMFNTDNVEVLQYFIEKALKLCEIGFDAIRLDHASGPTYNFWKKFMGVLKKYYPNVQIIGEVWGKLDFKPKNPFRYYKNKLLYSAQEARQMEYIGVLDGVLDFRYHELMLNALKYNKGIKNNKKLKRSIIRHFANYPANFKLWLFLDNHDLNRLVFECKGDVEMFHDVINYTKQWRRTFLTYYGTERFMSNDIDIRQMPYGDELVRNSMVWD